MKQYEVHSLKLENGETIAYREAGNPESAETVLLIHGNMSSSAHWQTTIEQLQTRYRVIAPDLRGFGDSTYCARFDSLRELALDIAQFVKLLGLDQFTVVGWSTGGGVVLELAAEMPERVRKVILVETVPVTGYPMFKKDASGQPIVGELLKTKEEIEADPVQVAPVLQAYAANNHDLLRAIWNAVIYNQRQPSPEDYEEYLTAIFKQRNLVDIDYSLLTFNMTDAPTGSARGSGRLRLVKCPITMIHGAKDLVVPYEWIAKMHADLAGRAKLITLAETGHSPLTDDPALFIQTLQQELAE